MTRGEALRGAAARLAATSATPRLDAELLMAHALGLTREAMLLHGPGDPAPAAFAALVERRASDEPVAYITGHRAFWTIDLAVSPAVLIPRADSETLIEAAVAHFGTGGPRNVLDLGTGSGALLLAALDEWPGATGVGIDASADALAVAQDNAARLRLAERARFLPGGWTGSGARFDLILCNPPYVPTGEKLARQVAAYEPAYALYAGRDGLDDYRRLAPLIGGQLAPRGIACIEIGATQAAAVTALFAVEGLAVAVRQDLGGRDRCLVVRA